MRFDESERVAGGAQMHDLKAPALLERAADLHGERDGFSDLVRRILMKSKPGRIGEVAEAMGMSYANFHARVTGRVRFHADEANLLLRVLPDIRLCEYLLSGTAFIAIERPMGTADTNANVLLAATELATAAVAIVTEVAGHGTAEHGGRPDPEQLEFSMRAAERALATLLAALSAFAKPKDLLGEARHECAASGPDCTVTVVATDPPFAMVTPRGVPMG